MIETYHQPLSGTQRMDTAKRGGQQIAKAETEHESLTLHLMEKICEPANLNRAYKRVKANKGAAGVDGLTVNELSSWIAEHKDSLIESLLNGTYQPQLVRGVEIPKPGNKGTRLLGVPCVVDRLVQQAIHQVLEPMLDPSFSASSYGFRPGRSAHQALKQAQQYVQEGVSQGGPLSPLMSNLMLDELDKELERRGHKFCRYADDSNIYVQSLRAGERVLQSIKQFLEKRLKLTINESKSGCASVNERQFLGYCLQRDGKLTIAKRSIERVRNKVRELTQRNRGRSLELVITELNKTLRGWINYFRLTQWPSELRALDSWIRRKLRCYRLKQRKKSWPIAKFLIELGVPARSAWSLAKSGKGWWRLSKSPPIHHAMTDNWFNDQGLINLTKTNVMLKI